MLKRMMVLMMFAVVFCSFKIVIAQGTVDFEPDVIVSGSNVKAWLGLGISPQSGYTVSDSGAYRIQLKKANADGSGSWTEVNQVADYITGYAPGGDYYLREPITDYNYGWSKYMSCGYGKGAFVKSGIRYSIYDPSGATQGNPASWECSDVFYPPKVGIHSVSISCNSGTVTISGVAKAMNRTNIDIVLQLQRSLNQSTWSNVSGSKDEELDQSTGEYATWSLSNSTYFPGTDYYYRAKMTITADGGFSATSYSNSIQCR